MSRPFVVRNTVRFSHTDPASYVFFPRYFEMLQAAVEEWFTQSLGVNYADLILKDRLGLPTARIECEFLKPSRLGENVDLAVYLERIGQSSLTLVFAGRVEGEMRLRAQSVLVVIELADGRPVALPEPLREQLLAYRKRQGPIPPAPKARPEKN
jgi:4-hydroxybenzoyl-CoA thioesterase